MTILPTACNWPGCPAIVRTRYCPTHEAAVRRRQDRNRPSSTARGYGHRWRQLRARVLAQQPYCACGARTTQVDHIVPLSRGGMHERANLRAMCGPCHSRRTRRETNARSRSLSV